MDKEYDIIIIGGGFYGTEIALFFAKHGKKRILIIEKEKDLLQRASYNNQARVHQGYHYPRSVVTALRSRINFPRFIKDYPDAVVDSFEKYYAIARQNSKVSAKQFYEFCKRIEAPIAYASTKLKTLFNPDLIEDVFTVQEIAFDAVKLKEHIKRDLEKYSIETLTNTRVTSLQGGDKTIVLTYEISTGAGVEIRAPLVFNTTYSEINQTLSDSHLPLIPLKHEMTEMALVKVPEPFTQMGITVMCGPFFSVMPFPARGLHSMSHVRYTPHHSWIDTEQKYMDAHAYFANIPKKTKYPYMIADIERYIPSLQRCTYMDSLWEVKTVLPQNEVDDGRPILFKKDHGLPGLTCVMGGKIDNIYDVYDELSAFL